MKKLLLALSLMLLLASSASAQVIKLNCVRTDYRDAKDDIVIINLTDKTIKISSLPDYKITKLTEDTIEAQNNDDETSRYIEFKRYTGKLFWLIFDNKKNRAYLEWYYKCSTAMKII